MILFARLLFITTFTVSIFWTPSTPAWASGSESCSSAFAERESLGDVLLDVFGSSITTRKEGWCSGNVYFQLKKMVALGAAVEDIKVLHFKNQASRDFRLWGTPEQRLNEFHVVLYYQGRVYDVHATEPKPVALKTYLSHMFFQEGIVNATSRLPAIIRLREFSGADYMTAFKQGGSQKLNETDLGHDIGTMGDFL